jgi:hypothetical protein
MKKYRAIRVLIIAATSSLHLNLIVVSPAESCAVMALAYPCHKTRSGHVDCELWQHLSHDTYLIVLMCSFISPFRSH